MNSPTISEEALVTAAEALYAEGRLTVRRLRDAVGGGDTTRVARVTREVRQRLDQPHGMEATTAVPTDLPEPLQDALSRLQTAMARSLEATRRQEADRSQASENALRVRQREEIDRHRDVEGALREDLAHLEAELAETGARLVEREADLVEARRALAASEVERRTLADTGARERLELTRALTAAAEARREVEEDAARLRDTLQGANLELATLRAQWTASEERRADLQTSLREARKECAYRTAELEQARANLARAEAEQVERGSGEGETSGRRRGKRSAGRA